MSLDVDIFHILDPETGVCPSNERIIQNINKCWGLNIDAIVVWKDTLVPNLDQRNGIRAGGTGVDLRGGKSVKKNGWGARRYIRIHKKFGRSSRNDPPPNIDITLIHNNIYDIQYFL